MFRIFSFFDSMALLATICVVFVPASAAQANPLRIVRSIVANPPLAANVADRGATLLRELYSTKLQPSNVTNDDSASSIVRQVLSIVAWRSEGIGLSKREVLQIRKDLGIPLEVPGKPPFAFKVPPNSFNTSYVQSLTEKLKPNTSINSEAFSDVESIVLYTYLSDIVAENGETPAGPMCGDKSNCFAHHELRIVQTEDVRFDASLLLTVQPKSFEKIYDRVSRNHAKGHSSSCPISDSLEICISSKGGLNASFQVECGSASIAVSTSGSLSVSIDGDTLSVSLPEEEK